MFNKLVIYRIYEYFKLKGHSLQKSVDNKSYIINIQIEPIPVIKTNPQKINDPILKILIIFLDIFSNKIYTKGITGKRK